MTISQIENKINTLERNNRIQGLYNVSLTITSTKNQVLDIGRNRKWTQSQREKVMTQMLELASRTLKQLINISNSAPPNRVIMKEQMRNFSREM